MKEIKDRYFDERCEAEAFSECHADIFLCVEYDWNAEEYVLLVNDVEIFCSQLKEEVMKKFREVSMALGLFIYD